MAEQENHSQSPGIVGRALGLLGTAARGADIVVRAAANGVVRVITFGQYNADDFAGTMNATVSGQDRADSIAAEYARSEQDQKEHPNATAVGDGAGAVVGFFSAGKLIGLAAKGLGAAVSTVKNIAGLAKAKTVGDVAATARNAIEEAGSALERSTDKLVKGIERQIERITDAEGRIIPSGGARSVEMHAMARPSSGPRPGATRPRYRANRDGTFTEIEPASASPQQASSAGSGSGSSAAPTVGGARAPSVPNRGLLRTLGGGLSAGALLGSGGIWFVFKDGPQTLLANYTSGFEDWLPVSDGFRQITKAIRAQATIGQQGQAEQAAVQAEAKNDRAPLSATVDARLRAKGIAPEGP
jgi:hypothetical protein